MDHSSQNSADGGADSRTSRGELVPREMRVPFVLVTALFLLWAIPNNLNDVLIQHFMKSFEMSRFGAAFIQFAFYLGYFLLAIPAALLMRRTSYKAGFVVGLCLYACGALMFWPAAHARSYQFFLVALFVIACGLSFLETASNPFVAQLGDAATSERRLNLAQAFNPIGSITGALIGTVFIFSGVELSTDQVATLKHDGMYQAYLRLETLRVVKPYFVIGAVALLWAVLILATKFPKIHSEHEDSSAVDSGERGHFSDLLKFPYFWLAVLAQFLYVGAQVGTWSYMITYFHDYAHVAEKAAGYYLTGSLVAFMVGRFVATALMGVVQPRVLMGVYSAINVALVLAGVVAPGWIGAWTLLMSSFFMSLMFPTIFALGLKGLGPNTKIGGSLLVMSIVGGAVFPLVMGFISDRTHSLALAYIVPLLAYAYIAMYSFAFAGPREPVRNAA
jgi:FHS family L-fucose permease-like MFS transporter